MNKPYGVLSQFSGARGERTLAAFDLPKAARVAGRLDKDSEGLLLLAEDGVWANALLDPAAGHPRRYWAFVQTPPDAAGLARLVSGVDLKDGPAQAVAATAIPPPLLPPRDPAPRPRPGRATGWIELTLREGRNRQVRRMCAAVDAPVLRLVRCAIGAFAPDLSEWPAGAWRALDAAACAALMTPGDDGACRDDEA